MPRPQNPTEWYEFTSRATGFTALATQLVGLWVYRYPLIVQNSNRGEDCPWARQAQRLAGAEREDLRQILIKFRDLATGLLADLDSAYTQDEEEI